MNEDSFEKKIDILFFFIFVATDPIFSGYIDFDFLCDTCDICFI